MSYQTPGKILVVDDEAQNVEVLRRLMTRLDSALPMITSSH